MKKPTRPSARRPRAPKPRRAHGQKRDGGDVETGRLLKEIAEANERIENPEMHKRVIPSRPC
jgi:hypothetical protein